MKQLAICCAICLLLFAQNANSMQQPFPGFYNFGMLVPNNNLWTLGNINPQLPQTNHVRKPFSDEEDQKLSELIQQFGKNNWKAVAQGMGTRSIRQCRERWTHYLDPNCSNKPWTEEERQIAITKFNEYGTKWKKIAEFLPNRNNLQVRVEIQNLNRNPKYQRFILNHFQLNKFLSKEQRKISNRCKRKFRSTTLRTITICILCITIMFQILYRHFQCRHFRTTFRPNQHQLH